MFTRECVQGRKRLFYFVTIVEKYKKSQQTYDSVEKKKKSKTQSNESLMVEKIDSLLFAYSEDSWSRCIPQSYRLVTEDRVVTQLHPSERSFARRPDTLAVKGSPS